MQCWKSKTKSVQVGCVHSGMASSKNASTLKLDERGVQLGLFRNRV